MNRFAASWVCATACMMSSAHAFDFRLYDDFGKGFINPSKWQSGPMCGSLALDCAREVANGALRYRIRGYGSTTGNAGSSVNTLGMSLTQPDLVAAIQTQVLVRSFTSSLCAGNPDAAHPQFIIWGAFFNTGSGQPTDNMEAYLQIEHRTDDTTLPANMVRVGGFMKTQDGFFNNVDLGMLAVGESATVTLAWERDQHDFLVDIVRTQTPPIHASARMPYLQSDTLPAIGPNRTFALNAFTPNCITRESVSAMDIYIDNVKLSQ